MDKTMLNQTIPSVYSDYFQTNITYKEDRPLIQIQTFLVKLRKVSTGFVVLLGKWGTLFNA